MNASAHRPPLPSPAPAADEGALAARVRAGDGEAFRTLFERLYEPLCRFAAGILRSEELAHEAVQEVFCRIWERRADWQPGDAVRAYLYRSVRNQALNERRRRRIRRLWGGTLPAAARVASSSDASRAVEQAELEAALWAAVEALPERRRMTFLLHRQHGLTYAEVAEVMGCSPKTVANQLSAALQSIRTSLAPFADARAAG